MQIIKKLKNSLCSSCREQKTLEESGLHQAQPIQTCVLKNIMVFFEVAYFMMYLKLHSQSYIVERRQVIFLFQSTDLSQQPTGSYYTVPD